jgi:hypothetical protein
MKDISTIVRRPCLNNCNVQQFIMTGKNLVCIAQTIDNEREIRGIVKMDLEG